MRQLLFWIVFDLILLTLAGNENMHESLDEFEFRPDLTIELAALECLNIYVSTFLGCYSFDLKKKRKKNCM